MEFIHHIALFFVSLIANMFSAFSGGGAGLLQLPIILFLGLTFSSALATHKVASVALGMGATLRHMRESRLDRKFALYILLCGLPGVVLGAMVILTVDDRDAEISLGILTLSLGVYSYFKKELGLVNEPKHRHSFGLWVGGGILFLIGALNGSLTSGTGLFVTLWLVVWHGLDYKRAVAYTLVLVGLFWNGLGALTLGLQTPIKWEWLPALFTGSLIGGYLGAHMSIVADNRWIKRVFELLTVVIGVKLIAG
ncbi:Predicted permease [hydrothermal vent metagenome]|uniref:Predicted permease n=1 Tax=hydrothermal vent metagenome TaxID=652676 RepID=A0A3B0YAZ9_9ZZZZ